MSECNLLVFDFDDSLCTNDPEKIYYRWLQDLAGPEDVLPKKTFRDIVVYQNEVFGFLYDKGKTTEDILKQAEYKTLTPGMRELLTEARGNLNTKTIIVTDNNSVVLDHSIKYLGIHDLIDKVISNPAHWNKEGRLVASPYCPQDHCDLSFSNLCKGDALWDYVKSLKEDHDVTVKTIGYVGDNKNDLCPSLRLREKDLIFPRATYPLVDFLHEKQADIKAGVRLWDSGRDILRAWKERLAEEK